ncbi:unnamed protein product [Protopolystoma xenopodis]|uniref:Uncharacterized protein n=1 Tax=Protopolystoma xenopodis TaxID=117903 RepID=A0A3S4ZWQ3_9PLAT|nr:unnamed protein product [Protopolystoma xenopodis]
MLLFDGEPLLFFLFSFSILDLLIGGCLWGSGESDGDSVKMYFGIVIFAIGCTSTVCFFFVLCLKKIQRRRRKRLEMEELMRIQGEVTGVVYDSGGVSGGKKNELSRKPSMMSRGIINPAAEL